MPLDLAAPPIPGISLRPIEPRDNEFLRELYRNVRDAELEITGWTESAKRAFTDGQFDHQDRWYRSEYPGAQLLVIEEQGEPVGRLYSCELEGELRLMDIALVPARRGSGLGTAIIRWLQELAASKGRPITLYVEPCGPAQRLYERLGFTVETKEHFHLRMRWAPAAS